MLCSVTRSKAPALQFDLMLPALMVLMLLYYSCSEVLGRCGCAPEQLGGQCAGGGWESGVPYLGECGGAWLACVGDELVGGPGPPGELACHWAELPDHRAAGVLSGCATVMCGDQPNAVICGGACDQLSAVSSPVL